MDAAQLRDDWKQNNHRPAWVREHSDAIHEHTDTSEPIPNGSLHAVRQWLDDYRGVVTRQLNDAVGETPTETDGEE